jgi:hypothetical protein
MMHMEKAIWVKIYHDLPQKIRKASLYSISLVNPTLPGTFDIVLAKLRAQRLHRTLMNTMVAQVGMMPDLWNVAGSCSIAGPVNVFMAIDTLPKNPTPPEECFILLLPLPC